MHVLFLLESVQAQPGRYGSGSKVAWQLPRTSRRYACFRAELDVLLLLAVREMALPGHRGLRSTMACPPGPGAGHARLSHMADRYLMQLTYHSTAQAGSQVPIVCSACPGDDEARSGLWLSLMMMWCRWCRGMAGGCSAPGRAARAESPERSTNDGHCPGLNRDGRLLKGQNEPEAAVCDAAMDPVAV